MSPVLVREQIENIAKHAGRSPVYFGVLAVFASYRRKPFRLKVKHFAEKTARSPKLAGIALAVTALYTYIIKILHDITSKKDKSARK